jgi:hypothetical protein
MRAPSASLRTGCLLAAQDDGKNGNGNGNGTGTGTGTGNGNGNANAMALTQSARCWREVLRSGAESSCNELEGRSEFFLRKERDSEGM